MPTLGRLETARLRGLGELIREVRQKLRLGATGLTGRILKARRDLSGHRLELGRVLLRELLHLAQELPGRGDRRAGGASHRGRDAAR